jgi:hypothetical protein
MFYRKLSGSCPCSPANQANSQSGLLTTQLVKADCRPVPFLMITNGGGVTEAERCKALSAELEVEVCPFEVQS